MDYLIIGVGCFIAGGIVGVVIMACCAAAGFASDVERWTKE